MRCSARQADIGFGLEQIDQQAAAIEPLADAVAAAVIGCAEQRMGAVDNTRDRRARQRIGRNRPRGAPQTEMTRYVKPLNMIDAAVN